MGGAPLLQWFLQSRPHCRKTIYTVIQQRYTYRRKGPAVATRTGGAEGINIHAKADRQLKQIKSWGYGNLPVCMAKTQYHSAMTLTYWAHSSGFEIPIQEFRLNAGAGFVVAVLGEIMTCSAYQRPAAADMDMDENGNLLGFG